MYHNIFMSYILQDFDGSGRTFINTPEALDSNECAQQSDGKKSDGERDVE